MHLYTFHPVSVLHVCALSYRPLYNIKETSPALLLLEGKLGLFSFHFFCSCSLMVLRTQRQTHTRSIVNSYNLRPTDLDR